jgi:hypothetical protein
MLKDNRTRIGEKSSMDEKNEQYIGTEKGTQLQGTACTGCPDESYPKKK